MDSLAQHCLIEPFRVRQLIELAVKQAALIRIECPQRTGNAIVTRVRNEDTPERVVERLSIDRSKQSVDNRRPAMTDVQCMYLPSTAGNPSSSDGCVNSLMCGFNHAPDSLIGVASESSGDNGLAPRATIVLECERTVAFCNTYQREAVLPLNIDGTAVNFGAYIADFHRAS